MNKVPCRVCGKPFSPCNKTTRELGLFNWREVACSPDCGARYLEQVTAGRAPAQQGAEADREK